MKKINLLLIIPILLAFLLGSRMVLAGDFYFLADQARDFLLAKDIIENNHITLIGTHSGLGGVFHGPLWLYMLVPIFLLSGGNPFAFQIFYVLLALITVVAGFLVGSRLYNEKVGLAVAFILAISPSIWSFVPNTIGINVIPLIYLLLFFFLVKFVRGNTQAFIFAIFFAGLTFQFETAAAIALVPVMGFCLFFNRKIFKNLKVLSLSALSFVLSMSTFILFDLRHNFLTLRSLTNLQYEDKGMHGYLSFPERVSSHLKSLEGVYTAVIFNDNILLIILLSALITIFLYSIVKHQKLAHYKKEVLLFILFPIFMFAIFLFYPYPIYHEYVLGLTIPVVLLTSLAAYILIEDKLGRIVVGLFLAMNAFFAVQHLYQLYSKPYVATTSGSYLSQKEVVDWIFKDAKGKEFGYFVYTPETFTYGMDYLFGWVGKEKYGYTPESKKHTNTYLILYPSLETDKGAHAFWKENVIKTKAKVVEKKTFPGNIIVEKLDISKQEEAEDPNYHQKLLFR